MGKKRKEREGVIYMATCLVNGKHYVGQTVNYTKRKTAHLWSSFKSNASDYDVVFHRALRKYGKINFIWEILEDGINELFLSTLEIYYINKYNSYINSINSNGYNMTTGGNVVYIHKDIAGAKNPAYDNNKYNFYHYDGREELNITQFEFRNKHKLQKSCLSNVILGKKFSTKGWVLDKKYLKPLYNIMHANGNIIYNVTRKKFRFITGMKRSSADNLFNMKYKVVQGWRLYEGD